MSLEDSLGEHDKGPRHLEAVASHPAHPKSQGKHKPYDTTGTVPIAVRFQRGVRSSA